MSSIVRPRSLVVAIGSALSLSATQAAVITVDTLADPGSPTDCSLRSAIEALATQTQVDGCYGDFNGQDTIEFENGLSGTITLGSGRLDIYESMSINGPGADVITIDAGGSSQVARVSNGASVAISGLTLTGGSAGFGAGLYIIGADVELSDCVLTGNSASYAGGAIEVFSSGTLYVDDCVISGNQARDGGGIAVSSGSAVIVNSTVSGNSAGESGGGLWVSPQYLGGNGRGNGNDAELFVVSSLITENVAEIGGGIGAAPYNYGYGKGPQGAAGRVAGMIERFRQVGERAVPERGAPPPALDPNLTITGSVISLNEAMLGGGIGVAGGYSYYGRQTGRGYYYGAPVSTNTLVATGNTISNNDAMIGGGLAAKYAQSSVQDTVVADNTALFAGGGIANFGSDGAPLGQPDDRGVIVPYGSALQLRDSTVSGNQVIGVGDRGDYYYGPDPMGGGVLNVLAATEIDSSTITGNSAPELGGGVASLLGFVVAYGSEISANEGGGVLSGYFNQFTSFASRIEDNTDGLIGGVACEIQSVCFAKYSSVTGNQGTIAGGIGADLGAMGSGGPRGWERGNGGGYSSVFVSSSTISSNLGGAFGGIGAPDVVLAHSTVAFNTHDPGQVGPLGGGGSSFTAGGVGTTYESSITHSIIANNESPGIADLNTYNAPISMEFSLVRSDEGFVAAGPGNLFDVDPLLGPLAFNGSSYSQTHALLDGSPAIDAGDPDISDAPDFDQRGPGFPRIEGAAIDMGAYERGEVPPEPELGLSDLEIDFGSIRVGQQGNATLTLTSLGTGPVTIGSIGFDMPRGGLPVFSIEADDCSGVSLQPDDSCDIELAFNPDARALFEDTLAVPSDAPDSPALVELNGQGVAPVLAISPAAVDFGAVEVGSSAQDQVSLSNSGDDLLTLSSVNVGAPFGAVTGEPGFCFETTPTTLAPGASCDLRLSFTPPSVDAFAGSAEIQSDSLGGDDSVDLSGSGVDGDQPPPPPPPPPGEAIPVPVMGQLATLLLGGGLLLMGWLGLRRRRV